MTAAMPKREKRTLFGRAAFGIAESSEDGYGSHTGSLVVAVSAVFLEADVVEKIHRTREQIRAATAHDLISKIKAENQVPDAKEIGRQFLRLPALIHQCGLCQAVAFLEAKKFGRVVDHLAQIISAPEQEPSKRREGATFAKQVLEAGMIQYQWLTCEALKPAQWLKRYSEAILNLKPGDTGDAIKQASDGAKP